MALTLVMFVGQVKGSSGTNTFGAQEMNKNYSLYNISSRKMNGNCMFICIGKQNVTHGRGENNVSSPISIL